MKVLHVTGKITPSKGQVMQLEGEIKAARDLKINWDTKIFCPKGSNVAGASVVFSKKVSTEDYKSFFQKVLIWSKFRKDFYSWLKTQEEFYDVILLRYNFHDPFQYLYLKNTKKPVYLIHHEMEVKLLKSEGGIISILRSFLEYVLGKLCLKHAHGAISVTEEISEYQKKRSNNIKLKTFVYPNGIDTDSMPIVNKIETIKPNLLFIAGIFAPWHGIDILLESISKSSDDFTLHLIGKLEAKYLKIAKNDKRIIIHGVINRNEIPKIASLCNIGIDSLALYRSGLKYSSSLKTRDYLSMGLPVFSACFDIFSSDFKFYKTSEPCIENILKFANEMKKYTREEVKDASIEFIDKKFIINNLYQFLKDGHNDRN